MARWLTVLVIWALCVWPSQAFWYEGPLKFHFLGLQSEQKLQNVSVNTCNATLTTFTQRWDAPAPVASIKAACATHQECILDNMDESAKAYMGTAAILLGLAPILLSSLGPTISEIGLLSLERPVLSLLISLGTAAVFPSRVLGHEDDNARRLLKRRYRLPESLIRAIATRPLYAYLLSACEYLLVLAAIVNIMSASWMLGVGSVVTFRCTISLLPLAWVAAPALIHGITSVAFMINRRRLGGPRSGGFVQLCRTEANPCIRHSPLPPGTVELNTLVMVFHGISALLGFLHVIFGILIYSSLLFVMIVDAAAILARYCAAVLMCRFVLIVELEGLRYVHQQKSGEKSLLGHASTFVSLSENTLGRVHSETESIVTPAFSNSPTSFASRPSTAGTYAPTPFMPRPMGASYAIPRQFTPRPPTTGFSKRQPSVSPQRGRI